MLDVHKEFFIGRFSRPFWPPLFLDLFNLYHMPSHEYEWVLDTNGFIDEVKMGLLLIQILYLYRYTSIQWSAIWDNSLDQVKIASCRTTKSWKLQCRNWNMITPRFIVWNHHHRCLLPSNRSRFLIVNFSTQILFEVIISASPQSIQLLPLDLDKGY